MSRIQLIRENHTSDSWPGRGGKEVERTERMKERETDTCYKHHKLQSTNRTRQVKKVDG